MPWVPILSSGRDWPGFADRGACSWPAGGRAAAGGPRAVTQLPRWEGNSGVRWDLVVVAPTQVSLAKASSRPAQGPLAAETVCIIRTRGLGASEVQIHWEEISLCLVLPVKRINKALIPRRPPAPRPPGTPGTQPGGGVGDGPLGRGGFCVLALFFFF